MPKARFYNIPSPKWLKKWLGYLDQYVIFPLEVKYRMNEFSFDTIFVLVDNAQGPWIPLVKNRPHLLHCHDFLALRSALGVISENPTSWSGKLYQDYIRKGFSKGRYFISNSFQTQSDLHLYLNETPTISKVIYNGLNPIFNPQDINKSRHMLSQLTQRDLSSGYLLHVGGNVWYKNRRGVIELYNVLCANYCCRLPLLLIGEAPDADVCEIYEQSEFKSNIIFANSLTDGQVCEAYSGAVLFLFPSLAEGFGWPIIEAMASGCPVVTTNEAPMTEVVGEAAVLISRRPSVENEVTQWAVKSAEVIDNVLHLSSFEREKLIEKGFDNVKRFSINSYIDKVERIYQTVLDSCTASI